MALTKVSHYGVTDYRLKINPGGTIDLDSGSDGTVIVRGDLAVNGGTITTTGSTLNLASTATTISIGAATGTLTINNDHVVVDSTAALQIPAGTTSDRPTPITGQIRYNTTTNQFEGYGGSTWRALDVLANFDTEAAFIAADTSSLSTKSIARVAGNIHIKVTGATAGTAGSIKDGWEPFVFDTVTDLLASRQSSRGPNSMWNAGNFSYVETSDVTPDITNAAGVPLNVHLGGVQEIHGSAFMLTDSTTDQFTQFNKAIQKCSAAKVRLNIEGLTIAIGKQENTNNVYNDISVGSPNFPTTRTYAILIPVSGFVSLQGKGTVKNLNENDDQYIFHSADSSYVEIGDHVTLNGNHTEHGWGGCLHLMGLEHLHLGRCTFTQDGICRVGASQTKRSKLITFTHPQWIDCWGTHCIGGKPGGFEEIKGDTMYFENVRGGLNLETEDVNDLNGDGASGRLWDTKIVGTINAVYAKNVNGIKDPAFVAPASVVVCTDAAGGNINIGLIHAVNVTSTVNAECLLVGGGQGDMPYSTVKVDRIHGIDVYSAFRYDGTDTGGEYVHIGSITGDGYRQIIKGRRAASAVGAPGKCRLLQIDHCYVNSVERGAFSIFNGQAKFVSSISRSNPCVVTIVGTHAYSTGDRVEVFNVVGMTELNDRTFTVTRISETQFSLDGEDSTNYNAYEAGVTGTGTGGVIGTPAPGDVIEELKVGTMRVDLIERGGSYIRDTETVIIDDMSWGDVRDYRSKQGYYNYALWIECSRIYVTSRLLSEDSHNQFFRLYLTDFADMRGIDQVRSDDGGGITFTGSGKAILRDGQIRSTGGTGRNGLRAQDFTGTIEMENFNLNGTGIDDVVKSSITKIRNCDILKAQLTGVTPGEIAAGIPYTQRVAMPAVLPQDRFTASPTTAVGNHAIVGTARYVSNEEVVLAIHNLAFSNFTIPLVGSVDFGSQTVTTWEVTYAQPVLHTPDTADWVIVGERG